jgi:hypothetical protein
MPEAPRPVPLKLTERSRVKPDVRDWCSSLPDAEPVTIRGGYAELPRPFRPIPALFDGLAARAVADAEIA